MHRLVQPTLTMLPPGVGEIISSHLSPKSVAKMQRTTKRTHTFTKQALTEQCNELPSRGEVVAFIKDMSIAYFDVTFLAEQLGDTFESTILTLHRGELLVRHNRAIRGIPLLVNSETQSHTSISAYITEYPNPSVLLEVLWRRKSCLTKGEVRYGVEMARKYLRDMVTPTLLSIMDKEQIDRLFSLEELNVNTLVIRPRPEGVEDILFNEHNIDRLQILAEWASNSIITDERSVELLVGNIRNSYLALPETGMQLPFTTTDVLAYIQRQLDANKPVRVSFYEVDTQYGAFGSDPQAKATTRIVRKVHELTLENANTGTYRTSGFYWNDTSDIQEKTTSGPQQLRYLLKFKLAPGLVDPATAYAILREKGIDRHDYDWTTILRTMRLAFDFSLTPELFRASLTEGLKSRNEGGKKKILKQLLLLLRWLGRPIEPSAKNPVSNILRAAKVLYELAQTY